MRAIGVRVVDRLVARLAREVLRALVAEHLERGWVGEEDHSVVIDDPDRLSNAIEDLT
jgi:hypothetical protein